MENTQSSFIGRRVLGRYRIVQLIAAGGMGEVFLARTEGAAGFVKPVVIKRVLPAYVGDEDALRMFVRE
ncbi:MAG: serine/threonine protein kinase, partial [Deltaproteobacteria bacterium]